MYAALGFKYKFGVGYDYIENVFEYLLEAVDRLADEGFTGQPRFVVKVHNYDSKEYYKCFSGYINMFSRTVYIDLRRKDLRVASLNFAHDR